MSVAMRRRYDPTYRTVINPNFVIPSTVDMIESGANPGHGVTTDQITALCRTLGAVEHMSPTNVRDSVIALLNTGWRPTP